MPSAKRWRGRRESLLRFEGVDGCWLWRGRIAPNGYGTIGKEYAHRVAYERARGPIPAGMELDHLCRVKACVNPDHLEVVTKSENAKRGLTGRHPKFTARRLTETQVREIRSSSKSSRALAQQHGVSHETIRCIRNGTYYAEVAP
jgi:hypothetical protein